MERTLDYKSCTQDELDGISNPFGYHFVRDEDGNLDTEGGVTLEELEAVLERE